MKIAESSHDMNFGMTKDEEEVYAVRMPFERKMDYFEQDFRRPVTKEEIRSKKRHKSYTHTKPRTEPAKVE